jgi:hypothetical protein
VVRTQGRRAAVGGADSYGVVTGGADGDAFAQGWVLAHGDGFVHGRAVAHGGVLVQAGVGCWVGGDASGAEPPGVTSGDCTAGVGADAAFGSGVLRAEDAPSSLAWT